MTATAEHAEKRSAPIVWSVRQLHIGWALEWARKKNGMTRAQVAEKVKCHKSWMSRLENGQNVPAWDFVDELSRIYGFHTETMKCGALPERLKALRSEKRKIAALEKKCGVILGGTEQLQLAEQGLRLPNDLVLRQIMNAMGFESLKDLLYGLP
jgi:transcriptional regulator with XRE-family HTH domain